MSEVEVSEAAVKAARERWLCGASDAEVAADLGMEEREYRQFRRRRGWEDHLTAEEWNKYVDHRCSRTDVFGKEGLATRELVLVLLRHGMSRADAMAVVGHEEEVLDRWVSSDVRYRQLVAQKEALARCSMVFPARKVDRPKAALDYLRAEESTRKRFTSEAERNPSQGITIVIPDLRGRGEKLANPGSRALPEVIDMPMRSRDD